MPRPLDNVFERRNWRAAPPVTVILGSSRPKGNTRLLVDAVFPYASPARIVDLADYEIAPYDYAHRQQGDDFLPLARDMAGSSAIVFATPVYWYAMSAPMKTFFDRLSDLLKVQKPLGRALAGKTLFAIATSSSAAAPHGFETPFAETAGYFDMKWGGLFHAHFAEDFKLTAAMEVAAARFADRIGRALGASRAAAQ